MKISAHREGYLREQIREMVALNPMITIRGLQKLLEHNTGRPISDKYLTCLLRKVRREAVVQSDRQKLQPRIVEVRERHNALRSQLYRIAYWTPRNYQTYGIPKPKSSERINAIRVIAQMDIALLKAELDVGAFEDRRMALEEMLRAGLLAQELHEQVVGVFRTYKLQLSPMQAKTRLEPSFQQ